jgi:hypothetical protein
MRVPPHEAVPQAFRLALCIINKARRPEHADMSFLLSLHILSSTDGLICSFSGMVDNGSITGAGHFNNQTVNVYLKVGIMRYHAQLGFRGQILIENVN